MSRFDSLVPWALPLAALVSPAYAVDYFSIPQAQKQLFPEATAFIEHAVTLDDAQRAEIKQRSGVRQRNATQAVWHVVRDGQALGWFIVDDVIGKHEFITYAAAISPDGHVIDIEIMSYRETHGGQVREAAWRANLAGKTLADAFRLGKDVPNISGATLSCRNVTDGVKRLLVLHDLVLRDD
jgi:Na+-translocating ferredoxin:NAD+ oxidoreductase RnfG subunit